MPLGDQNGKIASGGVLAARTVRAMDVTFERTGKRFSTAVAVRGDGDVVTIPGVAPVARLPHDLAQLIVEEACGISHGFWGLLAAGVDFRGLEIVRERPRRRPRSAHQLVLQRCADADALVVGVRSIHDGTAEREWGSVRAFLASTHHGAVLAAHDVTPDRFPGLCDALADAERTWLKLEVGASLRRTWQPRQLHTGHRWAS